MNITRLIRSQLNNTILIVLLSFSFPSIALDTLNLKPVGKAKLSVLFWDIYTAELFSETGVYEINQAPLLLKLTYHRDIEKDDLLEHTLKQWKKIHGADKRFAKWIRELEGVFPSIVKNERLSMLLNADNSCEFYHQENPLQGIENKDLCEYFIGIWISPNATDVKLRNQLVGKQA